MVSKYLNPDKHFILIKNDSSDLKDAKARMAMKHDFKECEIIVKNFSSFYNSYLSPDATFYHFYKILII